MTHEPVHPGDRVKHVQTLQVGTVTDSPDNYVASSPSIVTVQWDESQGLPQVLPRHLVATL